MSCNPPPLLFFSKLGASFPSCAFDAACSLVLASVLGASGALTKRKASSLLLLPLSWADTVRHRTAPRRHDPAAYSIDSSPHLNHSALEPPLVFRLTSAHLRHVPGTRTAFSSLMLCRASTFSIDLVQIILTFTTTASELCAALPSIKCSMIWDRTSG